MGDLVPLQLSPLVRCERWTAGWIVTVRPCPDDIVSLRHFDTEAEAAEYATSLKREHGFRVRPDRFDLTQHGPEAA